MLEHQTTVIPSMWSGGLPRLQIAWDATSFNELMKCPRRYQYSIVEGYRAVKNADQEFGGYYASATETFKKARLSGDTKEGATIKAVRYAVEATWLRDNEGADTEGHPWSGEYRDLWRCTGSEPYRNPKGNRAKCPWSHAGRWYPGPAPGVCGTCGSATETQRRWVSDYPAKDRIALIRAIVWWCDEQPEEGGLELYAFPDGTPAVELGFRMVLPWKAPRLSPTGTGGEAYLLVGYLDHMDRLAEEVFIADNKTTKNTLSNFYWRQYAPNTQVAIYDLAGSSAFPGLPYSGVRIDATQTLTGGARFGARVFYHTDNQREELLRDLRYWITQAEQYAKDNYWPMNRANCAICPFNGVCSKPPEERQAILDNPQLFYRKRWNPLEER